MLPLICFSDSLFSFKKTKQKQKTSFVELIQFLEFPAPYMNNAQKISIPCSPCLEFISPSLACCSYSIKKNNYSLWIKRKARSWASGQFFWTWGSWCFQNFRLVLMCRVEASTLIGIPPSNQCLRGLGLDCSVSTKHSSSPESPCLLIFSVTLFSVQCLCWAHSILLSFLISESATHRFLVLWIYFTFFCPVLKVILIKYSTAACIYFPLKLEG